MILANMALFYLIILALLANSRLAWYNFSEDKRFSLFIRCVSDAEQQVIRLRPIGRRRCRSPRSSPRRGRSIFRKAARTVCCRWNGNWKTIKSWSIGCQLLCRQVAAWVPDVFCNFYLVKKCKIANHWSSRNNKHSPEAVFLVMYDPLMNKLWVT
jgi:hypothetical protein